MLRFFSLIKKECYHILRDKRSLFVLLGMPIAQILIFGFALTNEVKDSRIAILDKAHDADTEGVIHKLEASHYFDIERNLESVNDIEAAFKTGKIKMAIVFEPNFRDNIQHQGKAQIQLIADASDPNTALAVSNYATAIIGDYFSQFNQTVKPPLSIDVQTRMLYNPQLKGEYNFVPGVMAMILLLISAMMTAVAIVREKELGTMEILLVSPMRPILVVFSKMIPFLFLSLINFSTILLISVHILGLPIRGDLGLLLAVSALYVLCALSMGLLISTITDSQRTALIISLMGLMMPTILFSGFMFPLENLPLPDENNFAFNSCKMVFHHCQKRHD
jgi:ABC-2 type transport system permease protein